MEVERRSKKGVEREKKLKGAVLRSVRYTNGFIDINATLITILLLVDSLTQREIQIINTHRVEILKLNISLRLCSFFHHMWSLFV